MEEPEWRPSYLGGGTMDMATNQVANTSKDASNEMGKLAGFSLGTKVGIGFQASFEEHCYIMGIMSARADLNYQQGIDRHWFDTTEYDFYWPEFAKIGEQAVLKREIFFTDETSGSAGATNSAVFGYQERYAHYKYARSKITGYLRSDAASTIEEYHLAQDFSVAPRS